MWLIFFKSILAGLSIALGGTLNILVKWGFYEANKNLDNLCSFCSGLAFSVGLFLVCRFKLELYTGKVGIYMESYWRSWNVAKLSMMLLGNLIGSIGLGTAEHFLFKYFNLNTLITITDNISKAKLKITYFDDIFIFIVHSLFCGLCVYLAVKGFEKGYYLLLPCFVTIFIFFNGDHCIANAYYLFVGFKIEAKTVVSILITVLCNTLGTVPGIYILKKGGNYEEESTASPEDQV